MHTVEEEMQLRGVKVVEEILPSRSQDVMYEVIDHHTNEGRTRLLTLASEIREVDRTQFLASQQELFGYRNLLNGAETEIGEINVPLVEDRLVAALLDRTKGISVKRIRNLIRANSFVKDLTWLKRKVEECGESEQQIEDGSRYLYNKQTGKLFQYLGPEAHTLLMRSRLLGIVPFEAVEKLKEKKIRIAGSSAVLPTVLLWASLGAENMSWWDEGFIDPSNLPRFTGVGIEDIGRGKAITLQQLAQSINPYGKFEGHHGRVMPSPEEIGEDGITFDDFARDADYVVEVVDNALIKSELRKFLAEKYPGKRLIYLADVGVFPFVGIETPGADNNYNQGITQAQLSSMIEIPEVIEKMPNSTNMEKILKKIAEVRHTISLVVKMVEANIPAEHLWQLVGSYLLLIPWSQTPIASRESAAIAGKLLIDDIMGQAEIGKNLTSDRAPRRLTPKYSRAVSKTLREISKQLFTT